jgi:hypothetical protein
MRPLSHEFCANISRLLGLEYHALWDLHPHVRLAMRKSEDFRPWPTSDLLLLVL